MSTLRGPGYGFVRGIWPKVSVTHQRIEIRTYHKFSQELNKPFTRHRPFNNIICNNTIKSEDWEDWKPTASHKTLSLNAPSAPQWPSPSISWCPLVLGSFIPKHKHVKIGDLIWYSVHENSLWLIIPLYCMSQDIFMGEMEPMQGASKCWKWDFHASSNEELFLDFIQVNCMFLVQ